MLWTGIWSREFRTKGKSREAPQAPHIDGWEARYLGTEPRLSEQVELFRELGFEVRIEPFNYEESDGCVECFKDAQTPIMVLYVKKTGDVRQANGYDDLFLD